MGNAVLWYKPDNSDRSYAINLGRKLRERQGPFPDYMQAASQAIAGTTSTMVYSGRASVRIGLTWQRGTGQPNDTDSQRRRRLYGLVAHLKRGGHCLLAEDIDYFWATFLTKTPGSRATVLAIGQSLTEKLAPSVNVSGREVYIHSDPDAYLTEMHYVSGHAANNTLTIDLPLVEDYSESRWVLLRESGSYPALRVPPAMRSSPMLTHDSDRVFYLDLPLEEDIDRLEDLALTKAQAGDESASGAGVIPPPGPFQDDPLGGFGRYRW